MLAKLRSHRPAHATLIAYLALFVALGGSSYAAVKITGKNVKDSSLTGRDVKDNSLTGRDVKALTAKDFAAPLPSGPAGPQGTKGEKGDRGAAGPTAATISFNQAEEASPGTDHSVGHVGPWDVSIRCYDDGSPRTILEIGVTGPGSFQYWGVRADNDSSPAVHTTGGALDPSAPTFIDGGDAPLSGFSRFAFTVQLSSGATVATLSLNALADSRSATRTCFGAGTAVLGG
jgi:hypothetical protein